LLAHHLFPSYLIKMGCGNSSASEPKVSKKKKAAPFEKTKAQTKAV